MPVLTPITVGACDDVVNPTFISTLVPEVLIRVENRTTDSARAAVWLRDALIEITMDTELRNEFDELEVKGPIFQLTGMIDCDSTKQEIDFCNLIPSGSYNAATLDIVIWSDPPTNCNRIRLNETSYQDADRISPFPGLPVKWYRFNDSVGFVPPPDQGYSIQARIYRMHPIASPIENTEILIARDWDEILVWAAVMRGFAEMMEYEKSTSIHNMLYGDPEYPQRQGLLQARKKRHEKESWRRQRSLRPVIRAYSRSVG